MPAVGGCSARPVLPDCGDVPPPWVASFIAAVGGCCGRADSAAAEDADVLGSAAPMAAVGGCCPVVGLPTAPAVGPAPASRAASSFVRFSISVVHGPAAAVPIGKATRAKVPRSNVVALMLLSPACEPRSARTRRLNVNCSKDPTFRLGGRRKTNYHLPPVFH